MRFLMHRAYLLLFYYYTEYKYKLYLHSEDVPVSSIGYVDTKQDSWQ